MTIRKDLTNRDYHAMDGLSSSNLKTLLESPQHYRYSINPEWKKESEAMDFGTAFHTLILEPEKFATECAIEPDGIEALGGKTKGEGKKAWDAFKAANAEKTIISLKDGKRLMEMRKNLLATRLGPNLLKMSEKEVSAFWRHPEGITLKARADMIIPHKGVILDLKTTTDASPKSFGRDVTTYGYHISAAHYLDVFTRATGVEYRDFVWIAVENAAPFGVAFYSASADQLEIGLAKRDLALSQYKRCIEVEEWPCYPEEIIELDINTQWL